MFYVRDQSKQFLEEKGYKNHQIVAEEFKVDETKKEDSINVKVCWFNIIAD